MLDGGVDRGYQVQVELLLDEDAQHAQRSAAQRVGVLAAGGKHADAEDTDQGIELVGHRHGGAGQGRG